MSIANSTRPPAMPNPNWAQLPLFDRSKWETVRFGDVVDLVSETSRNPEAEGITRFIGMEHLDPGSLHINTWGELVDGVTFTKRCRKGQVLFGKRRAYQRKVAIAEFDAVVSGDIYVFQAKEELLDPKLLPFLCMSERFFQFAVETSAGSLSPRTNWSHLKDFEFALPPLDQQRRIAELHWALDDVVQRQEELTQKCILHREALIEEHLTQTQAKGIQNVQLDEVASIIYGLTLGGDRSHMPHNRPYLRVANVHRNELDLSEVKSIGCDDKNIARFEMAAGDILIVEGHADVNEIGRSAIWNGEIPGALHQNHIIRVRCGVNLRPKYLNSFINGTYGRTYFRGRAKSSSGLNTINSTVVKEMPIRCPEIAEQDVLIARIEQVDLALDSIADHITNTKKVLTTILNQHT
jgi:type I restriction enzyme S subunit